MLLEEVTIGKRNRMKPVLAFLFCKISSERSRPDHRWTAIGTDLATLGKLSGSAVIDAKVSCNGPLGTTDELGCLVKLGSHVQVVDAAIFEDDKRVDLKVGKVEICVDIVKSDDKVYQSIFSFSCEGRPYERLDIITGREAFCVDGDF